MAAAAPAARAQATETHPSAGPTVLAASAAVRPSLAFGAGVPRAWDAQRALKRSETLMIVGGAIFLAGAIIGEDAGTIIMISGAAVGHLRAVFVPAVGGSGAKGQGQGGSG